MSAILIYTALQQGQKRLTDSQTDRWRQQTCAPVSNQSGAETRASGFFCFVGPLPIN